MSEHMSIAIPRTSKQWNVTGQGGLDCLKFSEQPVQILGDSQVLVNFHAASLNYRDAIIPLGKYPLPTASNVIPGSDGAGTVMAVGKHVKRFQPGDKVLTLFNQHHIAGPLDIAAVESSLGSALDGTMRTVGAFNEQGLVHMPSTLTFIEAATLPCAGLTAWNALFGSSDHGLTAGQWILTEGTGGVSTFAIQFAKAAGARVIATTSSAEKAKFLKELGADHTINYREDPEWGATARRLTGGVGVDNVVEVAGPKSMAQSLAAVKIGGVITLIGYVAGRAEDEPGFGDCLAHFCTARTVMVGSRIQMEAMCRAIEANPEKLRPVVDPKLFKLGELKEAYEYLWSRKHKGKVCVQIP